MADTAAHLVDRVFPEVPVRQWVLTLPFALRYRMVFDAGLTAKVATAFVRTVFASLRRRARARRKIRHPHAGAVLFVQRYGDALNVNVGFHVLAFDGVFDLDGTEGTRFLALPPPEDAEIVRVLRGFARRLARVLKQCGLSQEIDGEDVDRLALDQPLLAELSAASVRGRVATGPRAGQRVRRLGDRIEVEYLEDAPPPGCASAGGISVHAAVAVPGRDRERLEELQPDCVYARPDRVAHRGDHARGASVARRDGGRSVRLRSRRGLGGAWPRRPADHPAFLDIVAPARSVPAC